MDRIPGRWPQLAMVVRVALEERGATLAEAARLASIEPSALSRAVGLGGTGCGARGLARVARALGVPRGEVEAATSIDAYEWADAVRAEVLAAYDGGAP